MNSKKRSLSLRIFLLTAILTNLISCANTNDSVKFESLTLKDIYGITFQGEIAASSGNQLKPKLFIRDEQTLQWDMSATGMPALDLFYTAEQKGQNKYLLNWYSSQADMETNTVFMKVELGINSRSEIQVLISENDSGAGAGSSMVGTAVTMKGTYTATPVKDKATTYDLIVVYSDKTSRAYRVEIKDKDNILVWTSTLSYTVLPSTYTATGEPKDTSATGIAKAVATSAYQIGESEGHTILIESAEEKGDGKYSGNAQYVFERVNLDLSGTYNATPIDDSTSEYYCEFFFDYNGITHMGFKLTISDDGTTLDLTKLTFGVTPPTVDGTAATRNK